MSVEPDFYMTTFLILIHENASNNSSYSPSILSKGPFSSALDDD